jgi:hypothetical protein
MVEALDDTTVSREAIEIRGFNSTVLFVCMSALVTLVS